jgi:hypothetical protein
MSGEIRNAHNVSSRRICFVFEQEGVFFGLEGLSLAEYCGLGHLHDLLLDQKSDMELVVDCDHCYLVEHQDDDVLYYGLHSDNEDAFKSELQKKIVKITG